MKNEHRIAPSTDRPVAYFSTEFGIHESIPIYSGGLGVLAGDHLKSVADLDLPLVGVGLFYREAYFRQVIDRDGVQHAEYPTTDLSSLPIEELKDEQGRPYFVEVKTVTETLRARVLELKVGQVRLLLLDADVEGCDDRDLTARLYGGGVHTRIRQELLLGVGGVRALRAVGVNPSIIHLNEGHSAFAALELVRETMSAAVSFDDAISMVRPRVVFTTHTPVAAGHDRFEPELARSCLTPLAEEMGITPEHILRLGRTHKGNELEPLCMTVLALRLADRINGVSKLHGEVSREMWSSVYPTSESSGEGVPISHITNGVHIPSWVSKPAAKLFDQHLGSAWREKSWEPESWAGASAIPSDDLTELRNTLRGDLITFVRDRAESQARDRQEPKAVQEAMASALDPNTLTVGFARRFATYKRANLILRDLLALSELVSDEKRPVQFVFAGKAHPKDIPGQTMLKEVFEASRQPEFLGKIIFIADYDIEVGRQLVQGADVWLNNPRRPHEASGTSGQKVIYNAGLNCSILDGWWAEAFDGKNGFAIGDDQADPNTDVQDVRDAEALTAALRSVVDCFYNPEAWCEKIRSSIATLAPEFNSNRMVRDYAEQAYGIRN